MKNTYSTISGLALALLFSAGVSAQSFTTRTTKATKSKSDAVREAVHAIKRNEATANRLPARVPLAGPVVRPAGLRGVIPNDNCIDAIALTVNPPVDCPALAVAGTNAGATADGGDPACDATAVGFEDVWYSFNSGVLTSVTINIEVGDMTDLVTEVLEGCGGASVYCDIGNVVHTVAVTAGTDYVIRISSNLEFGVGGTFTICLSGVEGGVGPANDDCAGAIDMVVGTACVPSAHTMLDATQTLAPSTCSNFTSSAANDVWFSFTATGTVTKVQATGGGDATTGVDAVLEVYSGDCSALVSLGCIDATVRGGTEEMIVNTVIGTTYYYRVYYWIYTAGTPVLDFTTCVFNTTIPPNNECTGAVGQALAVGGSVVFNGDNTNATDTDGLGTAAVWESFTTTECTFLTIAYCGTTPAFENGFVNLFIGCPFTSFIGAGSFNADDCGDGNFSLFYEYVPAGTYYYAVMSEPGAVGPYTLTVSATACPGGYCTAGATTCDEYIAHVMFAEIDNASDCADGPVVDYTAISATVAQGATVPITVLNGPAVYLDDQVGVWIDWDQNENFTDAGEAYVLTSADGAVTFTGDITVPAGATLGSTRMRVRMMYTGTLSPCGTSAYGEVEDYTVNVETSIGLNEATRENWVVFPNPSNGDFTVQYADLGSLLTVEVIDNTGRLVHAERIAAQGSGMKRIALADQLAAGVYVLRMTTEKGRDEQRIVIR